MSFQVIVHIQDDNPFVADIDELPSPTATTITFKHPRTREQRQVPWVAGPVQSVIFPLSRILFMEVGVNPSELNRGKGEGFYRPTRSDDE